MQRPLLAAVSTVVVTLAACASLAHADVVDTRMLEQNVPVDAGETLVVVVHNVFGSVHVTAHDLPSIAMTATETVRGDLRADIDRARAEVELKTEREPGRVAFRVRRIGDDGDCACRNYQWEGYRVEYQIELRVPRAAAVDLSTVNDGDVTVDGVQGDFEVRNVNGAVRLLGLRGTGRATTVNGDIEASFARAPAEPTAFKTVNGSLDVAFPDDLSAELEFQTMHGEVYTDFDLEPISQTGGAERTRERGMFVLNSNRESAFRVRSGGHRHSFHTLNGDIYVRKAAQ